MTNLKMVMEDFVECDSFILIAIHCTIEDYRLAYILNNLLNIKLKRTDNDLDVVEAKYSFFEWEDPNQHITWALLSNICRIEQRISENKDSLFTNRENIVRTYNLVPEHRTSNYFLKISQQTVFFNEQEVIDKLLSTPQIVLAYEVETENLKSKTNLIIN
jgi:hypothetical protein